MKTELLKELDSVLKAFPHYWDGEALQRTRIIEDLNKNDEALLKALLSNAKIREEYTQSIDGITLFNKDDLEALLAYKGYWADSYTKYSNSIGLTSEGKYLEYNSDVVLDFPFKDCVLEGGMTHEDRGKEEVFFNEVIARDEVDTLLAPKVFTNSKRYSADGIEENITDIKEDDNLIIKGNNLLALHSLKERYAGKVKLIYIDPPYNTGNDSFKYNDRFNRSTWLTFMKNRLEIAKELLNIEGSIFVQCDDNEIDSLKILMDEIFGRQNFVNRLTVEARSPSAFSTVNPGVFKASEYILWFAKDKNNFTENRVRIKRKPDYAYNRWLVNPDEEYSNWKFISLYEAFEKNKKASNSRPDLLAEIFDQFIIDNARQITRLASISDSKAGADIVALKNKSLQHKDKIFYMPRESYDDIYILNGQQIIFYSKNIHEIDGELSASAMLTNIWTDIAWEGIAGEGRVTFNRGKKPERLIKRILELASNKNDLILDFFMGSGTTQAVAHKMNRQYIGIEQMDYIDELAIPRLNLAINGDQSGISKEVEWQGGGSFVYTELKALNQTYIEMIQSATDTEQLLTIFKTLMDESSFGYSNAYFDFRVDLDKLAKELYEVDGLPRKQAFQELELHDQKRLLIETLDKNQLYVNYSEMEDESYQVSEADQAFTHSFYAKDEA